MPISCVYAMVNAPIRLRGLSLLFLDTRLPLYRQKRGYEKEDYRLQLAFFRYRVATRTFFFFKWTPSCWILRARMARAT